MKKFELNRRAMLRGLLGGAVVSIGLPIFDAMLDSTGEAMADGTDIPCRFGVFYWGGGVIHNQWVPGQTGASWTLSPSLEPFGDLQPYMTLITGTNHAGSSPGHIPGRGLALSSSHDQSTEVEGVGTYRGQNHPEASIDSIIAEAWSGQATFDHMAVGICRKGPYKSNSSWKAGGSTYNRHEPSPQAVFDRFFKDTTLTPPDQPGLLETAQALDRSMLDAVIEDTRQLSGQLGYVDRQRLEQHLEGLRAIERRLMERQMADPPLACMEPDRPMAANYRDGTTREEKQAKAEIMADMVAVALACDLVRVFSFEWSATQSESHYWEVGIDQGHHEFTHVGANGDQAKIIKFIMQNYAYLARKLREVQVGDGNLLDHTLVLGTSEHASAKRHNYTDHPYLLLGTAGGKLRGGIHHRVANENNTDAPKVLLTAVRAVGVERASIGAGAKRVATETISAVEA